MLENGEKRSVESYDLQNAMKSQNKVSYLELSLSDCIEIKNDYPKDVYFLAINEWNSYEEQESEDTKILRKNADYFIDTFVDVQKVLETIRKDLIGIEKIVIYKYEKMNGGRLICIILCICNWNHFLK